MKPYKIITTNNIRWKLHSDSPFVKQVEQQANLNDFNKRLLKKHKNEKN